MKAYICDNCGKHAQSDYDALVPSGWFDLSQRHANGGGNSFNGDFCSADCLIGTIQSREQARLAEQKAAQPPEPPEPPEAPTYVPASPLESRAGVMLDGISLHAEGTVK